MPESTIVVAPSQFAFLLVLVIAAVFPLAIGLGFASVKAAATPAAVVDVEFEQPEPQPIPVPIDRTIADDDLKQGRYEVALQYYQSLGSGDSDRLPVELQYRIGLCQERLGLWDQSLNSFRSVASNTNHAPLKAAASFGQARVWFRLNEAAKSEGMLRALVLRVESYGTLPPAMLQDVLFMLSMASVQQSAQQIRSLTEGNPHPVGDQIDWPLETSLAWIDAPDRSESSEGDSFQQVSSFKCVVQKSLTTSGMIDKVEAWRGSLWCQHQSLESILEKLAAECGWSFDLTGIAHESGQERAVEINVESVPIYALLTLLCSELHSTWTLEQGQLIVHRDNSTDPQRPAMIAWTLESLRSCYPGHRLAGSAQFALAQLAQIDGHLSEAAERFASLVGYSATPLAIRAAYNAGLGYCEAGDSAKACKYLHFIVDGEPGHQLHVSALMLLGRLLLDSGEYQEAAFQFRRASESRSGPEHQTRGAAMMGLAYLMQEKPELAADAIFERRDQFEDSEIRSGAALVASFARFQTLKGEHQERETEFLFRSLMAVQPNPIWLGLSGQLLIGRSLSELGFDREMAELYSRQLKPGLPNPIASEMKYSLAKYHLANDQTGLARELWNEVIALNWQPWSSRAAVRLAELELVDGKPEDCLERCRKLFGHDGISLKEIQRLIGQAYEATGDDAQAARCYAGQVAKP